MGVTLESAYGCGLRNIDVFLSARRKYARNSNDKPIVVDAELAKSSRYLFPPPVQHEFSDQQSPEPPSGNPIMTSTIVAEPAGFVPSTASCRRREMATYRTVT
ncbi:hypothetical protein PSPO01_09648 [Paraphaeosphaeria sporulosa]